MTLSDLAMSFALDAVHLPAPKHSCIHAPVKLNFLGFLRTAKSLYITHADFLAFVGRAAVNAGVTGPDPAQAWLKQRGFPTDLPRFTPSQVSRALFLAQEIVAPQPASGQNGHRRTSQPHSRD